MKKIIQHLKSDWYKYALELIVITAGILGAFVLNSWNENRKSAIEETRILIEILDNLEEDYEQVLAISNQLTNAVVASNYLNEVDEHDIQWDSVSYQLGMALNFVRYHPIDNAYETLKSGGFKISNNDLRASITRFYEYEQSVVKTGTQDIEGEFKSHFRPFVKKYIRSNGWFQPVKIIVQSPEFIQVMKTEIASSIGNTSQTLKKVNAYLETNLALQNKLRTELER